MLIHSPTWETLKIVLIFFASTSNAAMNFLVHAEYNTVRKASLRIFSFQLSPEEEASQEPGNKYFKYLETVDKSQGGKEWHGLDPESYRVSEGKSGRRWSR